MNHKSNLRTPYPRISFERAYGYLLKIRHEYPNTDALSREEMVTALGLSPTSGTTHTALGALSHYGLARKVGVQKNLRYQLTDLAFSLVESDGTDKWRSLAIEAVSFPEAFEYLYSYGKVGNLPTNIEALLVNNYKEINKKNVKEILNYYYDSLAFIERYTPLKPSITIEPKQYEVSLGNGVTVSVTEEVMATALKNYLKDYSLK